MKELFKSYYRLNDQEFKELWENAVFVFDANVLLNLYRYQSSTRDTLLKVMEQLSARVWIPYHVGLEYQRNRLKVIADQHKRFAEVQDIVSKVVSEMKSEFESLQLKKRHSYIDPDKLVSDIENVQYKFVEELNKLEEQSININSQDEIRDRIDKLFEGRVGPPPTDQTEIDKILEEGESRYKESIPPGFKDSSKDEKSADSFTYAGILYKRKFGDLIIWKQLIQYAIDQSLKNVIFITDDSKADWWWRIESRGSKTIGARPELSDEIFRLAQVEKFHIYNTENFLNYSNEQLDAQVTKEAIEEVREISKVRRSAIQRPGRFRELALSAEREVYNWLNIAFDSVEKNHRGAPDFIGFQGEKKFGFEVKVVREPRMIMHRIRESIYRAYYLLNEQSFYEVALIFVVFDEETMHEIEHRLRKRTPDVHGNVRIVIGKAEYSEDENYVYGFIPYTDFLIDHGM